MNNFIFNVKQLKINKFMKHIWQLIISTSNATLEVPSARPCEEWFTDQNSKPLEMLMMLLTQNHLMLIQKQYSKPILLQIYIEMETMETMESIVIFLHFNIISIKNDSI